MSAALLLFISVMAADWRPCSIDQIAGEQNRAVGIVRNKYALARVGDVAIERDRGSRMRLRPEPKHCGPYRS